AAVSPISRCATHHGGVSPRTERGGLWSRPQRDDRIPLGGGSIGPSAGAGGRSRSPSGRCDRRASLHSRRNGGEGASETTPIVFLLGTDPVAPVVQEAGHKGKPHAAKLGGQYST